MKRIALLAVAVTGLFAADFKTQIPITWDPAALDSMQLPLATKAATPVHATADFYHRIPVMRIYKSYPIYAPGREPVGYLEGLKNQEPQIVFDRSKLRTEEDWLRAGELVFDAPTGYDRDPVLGIVTPEAVLDPKWYELVGTPVTREGIMPFARYVIRKKGVIEIGNLACGMCHTRVMPNGSILKGAQGNFPFDRTIRYLVRTLSASMGEIEAVKLQRLITRALFGAPWLTPDPLARIDTMDFREIVALYASIPPGVLARNGTSAFYPVQIPDLIGVRERRHLDHTGLLRHRGIGDLMRYSALNQGAEDFSSYGGFRPVTVMAPNPPDPSRLETAMVGLQRARYDDAQLYALALYLYSLKPPLNPNKPSDLSRRGQRVFEREGCGGCHTAPLYTNNKLTPVDGFAIPDEHKRKYDILPIPVGTDPALALKTRRGTGYYKIPSLKGLWYRGPIEHNGSIATLEDWFDPARLRDDYGPTGFKGYGVKSRAVTGHLFGLNLNRHDKAALIAFLKTL